MTLYQVCYLAVKLLAFTDGTVSADMVVKHQQCDVYEMAYAVPHDGDNGTLSDGFLSMVDEDLTERYGAEEIVFSSVSRFDGKRWVLDGKAF